MAPSAGYCGYQDCISCVENLCFFVEFLNRTLNCEVTVDNLDNVRDWINTTTNCPPPANGQDDQECNRFDLLGCSLFLVFLGLGFLAGFLAGKFIKMPGPYDRLRETNFEAWRQRGTQVLTWIRLGLRWLGICQRISTCCIRVGEGLIDNEVHAEEDQGVVVGHGPLRRPQDPPPPPPPLPAAAISPPPQQQAQVPQNRSSSSSSSTESIPLDHEQDQDAPLQNLAQDDGRITAAAGNIAGNLPLPNLNLPSTSTPLVGLIPPPPTSANRRGRPSRLPVSMKSYGSTHARSASANDATPGPELRRSTRTQRRPWRLSYKK